MTMRRASTTTFLLAMTTFVALAFSNGEACENVTSMSIHEACSKSCGTVSPPLQVQLCQSTLQAAGVAPFGEITVYAVAAAKAAMLSYKTTMAIIDRLLEKPSLPDREKSAYLFCQDRYGKVLGLMISVTNGMSRCVFKYTRGEYDGAIPLVTACANSLTHFESSPLYTANVADQDKTKVAYDLADLIVGNW